MTAAPGAELADQYLRHSPFAQALGLRLGHVASDCCELVLPFRPSLATYGDVVHGGVISALADTAVTAAALFGAEPAPGGGATVDITVHFLRAAHGESLRASARVLRRGRSLCTVEVEVSGENDPHVPVAKAVGTYKLQQRQHTG